MPCPVCGGERREVLQGGRFRCTSPRVVDVVPPFHAGNPSGIPIYGSCGATYTSAESDQVRARQIAAAERETQAQMVRAAAYRREAQLKHALEPVPQIPVPPRPTPPTASVFRWYNSFFADGCLFSLVFFVACFIPPLASVVVAVATDTGMQPIIWVFIVGWGAAILWATIRAERHCGASARQYETDLADYTRTVSEAEQREAERARIIAAFDNKSDA